MVKWKEKDGKMTVYLHGEIDHYAAETLRDEIEKLIEARNTQLLVFDFSHVTFMDSSGIGMLIGRYKTMMSRKGRILACGLTAPVERIYKMAGLHRIITSMEGDQEA